MTGDALSAPFRDLSNTGWAFHSPTYGARQHAFRVRTNDPHLGSYVAHLLEDLQVRSDEGLSLPPASTYTLVTDADEDPPYTSYFERRAIRSGYAPHRLVQGLLWHVTHTAAKIRNGELVLHGGTLSSNGSAVVIVGPSEAGKSTLVTALARAGMSYGSDELAIFQPATRAVHAYPKPIQLDPGSQRLFQELEPSTQSPWGRFSPTRQWLIPASALPTSSFSTQPLGTIVIYQYDAEAPLSLSRVDAATAVRLLAPEAHHFQQRPDWTLAALQRVCERARCYVLLAPDTTSACEAVRDAHARTGVASQQLDQRTKPADAVIGVANGPFEPQSTPEVAGKVVQRARPREVHSRSIGGDELVYDSASRQLHQFTGSVAAVWRSLTQPRTPAELARHVASGLNRPRVVARSLTADALWVLADLDLVDWTDARQPGDSRVP